MIQFLTVKSVFFFFSSSIFIFVTLALFYSSPSSNPLLNRENSEIWNVEQKFEWRLCKWWSQGETMKTMAALPERRSNGYIRVDCFGGLNQMKRDLCDGVGIATLLNATLVLPNFHVASYWNESSGFGDVFDVDYFIEKVRGYVEVVKGEIGWLGEAYHVDCRKRKGHFDYIQVVLPLLLQHHFISLTPSVSQRRDRYPERAKAAVCQACYRALRLTPKLEKMAESLLESIPKPFISLHLRFEPDMVAYSRCTYPDLSPSSLRSVEAARTVGREPFTGDAARLWRARGKCPLTPTETALILRSLNIPAHANIYLAAGDALVDLHSLSSLYPNLFTKSSFLALQGTGSGGSSSGGMHGNTKAALDFHVSVNSYAYVGTYFGNMDKMVAAERAVKGLGNTLFLSRSGLARLESLGLTGPEMARALWRVHRDRFSSGFGSALPDCFCREEKHL